MNKKSLFFTWGAAFILCAGLGFIQEPGGSVRILLLILSLLFFLPPALLLFLSVKTKDTDTLKLLRNLSISSLLLTLLLIVLNICSVRWPTLSGDILNSILIIVSSPMICSGNWFLSMFLWACLLMFCLKELKK